MNSEIIIYKELSDEELASSIFAFYDYPKNAEPIAELKSRIEHKKICSTMELTAAYSKLSNIQKIAFQAYASELPLAKDFYRLAKEHKVISDKYQKTYGAPTQLLLFIITSAFDVNSISEISPNVWINLNSDVKDESATFKSEYTEHCKNAFRKVATLLDVVTKDPTYKRLTRTPRNTLGNVDIESSSLSKPNYNGWLFSFQQWVETLGKKTTKEYFSAFRVFLQFLYKFDDKSSVVYEPILFASTNERPSFYNYLKETDLNKDNIKKTASYIQQYIDWLILDKLCDLDPETGEKTVLGYQIFSSSEYLTLTNNHTSSSNRPVESPKKVMPTKWVMMCKKILKDNNFAWPKSLSNQYFEWYDEQKDKWVQVWNPVLTYVYLIMFELPLRKIQVISLDSGEGDTEKYDLKSETWIKNDNPNARHWAKNQCKKTERGVLKKTSIDEKTVATLYINTNKTADSKTGFGEQSGYHIPWSHPEVIKLATELRCWQEKFNPVDAPRKFADIPYSVFSSKASKTVASQIPDRFYLFRNPASTTKTTEDPPTESVLYKFWYSLMAELEKRLHEIGEDVEIITKWNTKTNQPEQSIFSPHGLRVTGLTSFLEAGVPIEILSKIVAGHSSILMTLHYIKFNPSRISEILSGAQKKIEESEQANYLSWLRNAAYEDALKNAVCNDLDSLYSNMAIKKDSVFETTSIGICPHAGTRCNDGGKIIRINAIKGKAVKNSYAAVDDGDCLNCRHFITGAPWLIPLWLKGNKLLEDSKIQSESLSKTQDKLNALQDERYKIAKTKGPEAVTIGLKSEIKKEEALLQAKTDKLDKMFNDIHKIHNLIEKINAISKNQKNSDKFPIIISDEFETDEKAYAESSNFRILDLLVRASDVYSHIDDESTERERNQIIDQVMFEAGATPISFSPLTKEQKKLAHNAVSAYLAETLNDYELKQLEEGHLQLPDLGVETKDLILNVKRLTGSEIPLLTLDS